MEGGGGGAKIGRKSLRTTAMRTEPNAGSNVADETPPTELMASVRLKRAEAEALALLR